MLFVESVSVMPVFARSWGDSEYFIDYDFQLSYESTNKSVDLDLPSIRSTRRPVNVKIDPLHGNFCFRKKFRYSVSISIFQNSHLSCIGRVKDALFELL